MDSKIIWIVGSSSGIGLELLKILLHNNFKVIASSRNILQNKELCLLKPIYNENLHLLNIDTSIEQNVQKSVEEAFNIFNRIDIFFYNAGVYEKTDIFNINLKDFEEMININFLGVVRILKHLLVNLEKQKNSKIILNASLSSYFGLPYASAYGSSKAALVNFAQSIQPELINKNIQLQIINHGFVNTRLTMKNDFDMPQLLDTSDAAKIIFREINKSYRFEISFPFILSKLLKFISLLPYSLSLKITRKFLK